MRSRYQPLAIPTITQSPFVLNEPYDLTHVDVVEIGCGKGKFIVEHAKRHPKLIHIAIEQSSDVLYRAVQKMAETPLSNLYFIWGNADEVIPKIPSFDILYLQFSDPWPKTRHEKRRLTTKERLKTYHTKVTSKLFFKTDNLPFYEYSVEEVNASPFTIITHGVMREASEFTTEFEDKYRKLKKPIYYIEAKP